MRMGGQLRGVGYWCRCQGAAPYFAADACGHVLQGGVFTCSTRPSQGDGMGDGQVRISVLDKVTEHGHSTSHNCQ